MKDNSLVAANPATEARGLPVLTAAIIVLNAAIFAIELARGDDFVFRYALTPADVVAGHNWTSMLTATFLHGGWMHIFGNTVFLWLFGAVLESEIGHLKYAALYLAGGVFASLAEIAADPGSMIPSVGASGAICAVMGAYLVAWRATVASRVFVFPFSLRMRIIPAVVLIVLFSAGFGTDNPLGESVAYTAHIGGLLFGAVTGKLLLRRSPPISDF